MLDMKQFLEEVIEHLPDDLGAIMEAKKSL
jgi:hypothetical protein